MSELGRTALHGLHLELGARMVPFAGYDMPVQFPMGVLREHLHTRTAAGLFDVSHMGQVLVRPMSGDMADAALALESLIPIDLCGLLPGRQRYGMFTNDTGGISDDLMVAHRGDHFLLVVNAACKEADLAYMQARLPGCHVAPVPNRGLMALQGPLAAQSLAQMIPDVMALRFMDVATLAWQGHDLWVTRSGYSGEDGFEISVPNAQAMGFARALLALPAVAPIGLGARDSLRLEAGLCLYGHDITPDTSPVEAALAWAISKARRAGGARAGGFPGADRILEELADGPPRLRVGLLPEGRAPMREGTELFATATSPTPIGHVTSGGFAPSLDRPIAMGYVPAPHATPGNLLFGAVRGKRLPLQVCPLPFRFPTYQR